MLDREACERRVYRLATLLTGNPVAATRVIARVVDAQPDLRHLDSAHMDRLTVLRSREIAPAVLAHHAISVPAAEALAKLTQQQREAWVFTHVYQMQPREVSRAMDCSVTATQRHLEQAEERMRQMLGDQAEPVAAALLQFSMSLDVPVFYRMQRQRRRTIRMTIVVALAAIAVLLAILGIVQLLPMLQN